MKNTNKTNIQKNIRLNCLVASTKETKNTKQTNKNFSHFCNVSRVWNCKIRRKRKNENKGKNSIVNTVIWNYNNIILLFIILNYKNKTNMCRNNKEITKTSKRQANWLSTNLQHTHTHTYIYLHAYIHIL